MRLINLIPFALLAANVQAEPKVSHYTKVSSLYRTSSTAR